MPRLARPVLAFAVCFFLTLVDAFAAAPPLRTAPPPSRRPMGAGRARFVDARLGDDRRTGEKAGEESAPWRTIGHALRQLQPGDTLYLRAGVFYENVYLALAGRPDAPITIRSYPGESATIDGGWSEFFDAPADAWEPVVDGAPHEFRSRRAYPNQRDAVGSLGDTMLGLQTYYHAVDFRSTNELIDWEDWQRTAESDLKPLYCGPGVWYDRESGRIHVRLAHTHLPAPMTNYQGETDPRKLPLVLAPFSSTPLTLDGARHLRIQDLTIRGAGYNCVLLDQCVDIAFDNVTVWCGTYGLRANGVRHLRLYRSSLIGSVAPWTFRADASKRDYPGRPHRNLSRLNTHALIESSSGLESSVYATPQNDHWEIAYCDLVDAHDGVYLGGINARFHHNLVDNLQDDGIYLSPIYLRHRLDKVDPQIHVYENLFRGLLTALAFGGSESDTKDRVSIYRNVFDLRQPVNTGRPSTKNPQPNFSFGKLIGDHGSPPWAAMNIYHNTMVAAEPARDAAMASLGSNRNGYPRRVFNNIFYHAGRLPTFLPPSHELNVVEDGNVYWSPEASEKQTAGLFTKYRTSPAFEASKQLTPDGSTSHSLVADPRLRRLAADSLGENDYRLATESPASAQGVALPADWPDTRRTTDARPASGAMPRDASEPFQAGRRHAPSVDSP